VNSEGATGYERVLGTLHLLRDQHGAVIDGYGCHPDGAFTFDVSLSRYSASSILTRLRMEMAERNLASAVRRRD